MKNRKDITDQEEVNNELVDFYNNLLKNDKRRPNHDIAQFFSSIEIPRLTEEQPAKCEILKVICALKNMSKNKFFLNDDLTKEFYETLWDELKIPFLVSLRKSFLKEELSNSQRQVIIRLIETKDKGKRSIQNLRPLSLLDTDVKILSKVTRLNVYKRLNLFLFLQTNLPMLMDVFLVKVVNLSLTYWT